MEHLFKKVLHNTTRSWTRYYSTKYEKIDAC